MKVNIAIIVILLSACGGGNTENYVEDPLEKEQWYLNQNAFSHNLSINLASDIYYKGRGVTVAIVDNGVDIDHEDLRDNVGYGNYSYLTNDYNFSNADHGTSVAGIIVTIQPPTPVA